MVVGSCIQRWAASMEGNSMSTEVKKRHQSSTGTPAGFRVQGLGLRA
jgi:hypothetical protein